jgi:hypothetical protein
LAREKVLQELGDLPVPLVKLDFSIKQGPCSSGGIWIYPDQRLRAIVYHPGSLQISAVATCKIRKLW